MEAAPPLIRVVGLCGSLRKCSYNRGLLRAAMKICSDSIQGMKIEYIDISPLPMINTDLEVDGTYPPVVEVFRQKIREADSILFASPEYNYSITRAIDASHSQETDLGNPLTPRFIPFSAEDLDVALSELQIVAMSFDLSPSSRVNPSTRLKNDLRPLLQFMNDQPLTFSRHAALLTLIQRLRDNLPSSTLSTVRPHQNSLHSVVNFHQAQTATYFQKASTFHQVEVTLRTQATRA